VEQARLLANAGEFERFVTVAPRIAQVTLDDYEQRAASTAVYPGQGTVQGLVYTVLGLAGEAGEMANQVKKTLRDDDGVLTDQRRAKLVDELGDVLWYVANTAKELGVPLADIAQQNLNKLQARKEQGTLKGDQREGRTLGIGRLVPAGLKSIEMPIAEGGC
jgi:NTP pyrophosphatase (non-canonical NTP hydrolase)